MKPARRPKRYDDILDVPDTKVAEIIDGEVIVSPAKVLRGCGSSIRFSERSKSTGSTMASGW